jgi:protein subunit release factor A
VELAPEDLRIEVTRMEDEGPCGVRVIHTPTGTSAWADGQASNKGNRDLALSRLREKMSGP